MKKYIFLLGVIVLIYSCKDTVWEPIYSDKEQLEIDTKILEDYMKENKIQNFQILKKNDGETSIYDELGKKLIRLENGVFYYEYEKGGGGESPIYNDTITSIVRIYYEGGIVDGNIFAGKIPENDKTRDTLDTYQFTVSYLIEGWRSSLPLMKMGILERDTSITNNTNTGKNDTIIRGKYVKTGKSILFIPSRLAYGVNGNLPAVSFSQPLIFRVELESVSNQIKD